MSKRPTRPQSAPRNPLNGFMLFSDDQKKALRKSGTKGESRKKQLTALWRSNPAKRHHYNKKAKELMEKYNEEMKAFQATKEGKKYLSAMKAYNEKKKAKNSKKKKGSKKKKTQFLSKTKKVSFTPKQLKALQKRPENRTATEKDQADELGRLAMKQLKISPTKSESKGSNKMKGEKKKPMDKKKAKKDKKDKKDKKKSKKGPKKA